MFTYLFAVLNLHYHHENHLPCVHFLRSFYKGEKEYLHICPKLMNECSTHTKISMKKVKNFQSANTRKVHSNLHITLTSGKEETVCSLYKEMMTLQSFRHEIA